MHTRMNPSVDVADLLRYLMGESSEDEALRVRAWCDASTANAALLNALRHAGDVGPAYLPIDVARAMERLRERLDEAGGSTLELVPTPPVARQAFAPMAMERRARSRTGWYALAGMVLGVIALAAGWRTVVSRHARAAAPVSVYATGAGERANITLPDGNTVALSVASRLEVPVNYLTGNHVLRLHGEALFTVRHQPGEAFTVLVDGAVARVLGTSFMVRRYTADTTTIVAVRDGKVAVRAGGMGSVVLTAARQVVIGEGSMRVGGAEPGVFGFATGVLTLSGGLFSEAIPELDRWYDADIRLGDSSLARRRLTGEYAAGSLADLTELLQGTYGVRVVRTGRILTLYRR